MIPSTTYVVNGLVVEVLGRNGLLDDLLLDLLAELLGGDILAVLGGYDDSVDTEGNNGAVVVLVLDGNLSLGVGAEPWEGAVTAGLGHGSVQLVGELKGKGEELGGLVGGITEHDTLVTGTEGLKAVVKVETLGDIGGLLLDGDEKVKGLVVKALGRVVVTNVLDGLTDNLLVVDLGLGGNLTEDHDHTSLGGSLASNLGHGVLGQAGVEDGIGNLIGNLVGVTLTYGLGLIKAKGRSAQSRRENSDAMRGWTRAAYGEEEGALVVVLPAANIDAIAAVGCTVGGHCEVYMRKRRVKRETESVVKTRQKMAY